MDKKCTYLNESKVNKFYFPLVFESDRNWFVFLTNFWFYGILVLYSDFVMLKQVWTCPILSWLVESSTNVLFINDFVILRQVQTCLDKHRLNMFELVQTCSNMLRKRSAMTFILLGLTKKSLWSKMRNDMKCFLGKEDNLEN